MIRLAGQLPGCATGWGPAKDSPAKPEAGVDVTVKHPEVAAFVPSCLACLAGPRLRLRESQPPPAPIIVGVGYRSGGLCPVGKRFVKLLRTLKPTNLDKPRA